jgi:glycosyltransferase involved in cell wall biosynthesis
MARGCPVVSTEIGIEGIDVTNGKHAIFANEPEDFVNGIYSIVSQPAFAINMSISAREFVEENYNVKKSAYNRIELFKNKLV